MHDYEPNQRKVKQRSSDAASESSAKFRTAVTNRLDALGEHRRAFRVRTCRPRKTGGYSCRDGVLCDHCRNVVTVNTKRNYASRVLAAMKSEEPHILLAATLTMGESVDLHTRCEEMKALLGSMKYHSDAWSKVGGWFFFLHEERGESRRKWRPHYHCVLVVKAADFIGIQNHYRRLVLAWTRAAWAVLHPQEPIPKSEKSGSPFRTLLNDQRIQPLYCFQRSPVRPLQTANYKQRALVEDLSSLIEYGLKRKEQDKSHPRGPRMRPRDYVDVALRTNNKRGLKGCLYGLSKSTLRESAQDLEQITSPVEAEETSGGEWKTRKNSTEKRRTR